MKNISLNYNSKEIKEGESFQLKTTISPKTAIQKVTYSSSNTKIATATAVPSVTKAPAGDGDYTKLSGPRTDAEGNITYDCVYFGNYPQSDATGETKDPIKWRILSINGTDAFLVADQNLDVFRYNEK